MARTIRSGEKLPDEAKPGKAERGSADARRGVSETYVARVYLLENDRPEVGADEA